MTTFAIIAHSFIFFFFVMLTGYSSLEKKKKLIYLPLVQLGMFLTVLGTLYYHVDSLVFIQAIGTLLMPYDLFPMFIFDNLTKCMLALILFISTVVQVYSIDYMAHDENQHKFMAYLILFTAFMILLVISNNLLLLFIGWEGVGLSSFLLINFWSTRALAQKAALKAILVNRIGDLFLLYSFTLFYNQYETFDINSIAISALNPKTPLIVFDLPGLDVACFFLIGGAAAKSAQLFLHTWLPDAMEGPTPVSALIHAATMVTAGVFIIIRCAPILEYSPKALTLLTMLGALTALFGAMIGYFQNDIKRIIAFSTTSQLGYMVTACGLSHYNLAFYHLLNHAFFKAALFLSAGAIIHALSDEQDVRRMGGLHIILPFTYVVMFWSSLSLCGFPFLSGYFSKHPILDLAYSTNTYNLTVYLLLLIAAIFTSLYSVKLLLIVFTNRPKFVFSNLKYIAETPVYMLLSLICLVIPGIFFGYMFQFFFDNPSTFLPYTAAAPKFDNSSFIFIHPPFILNILPLLPLTLLASIFMSESTKQKISLILNTTTTNARILEFMKFNIQRWGFDKIYSWITSSILKSSKFITERIELALFNEVLIEKYLVPQIVYWIGFYRYTIDVGVPYFMVFVMYWATFILIITWVMNGTLILDDVIRSFLIAYIITFPAYVRQIWNKEKRDREKKKGSRF